MQEQYDDWYYQKNYVQTSGNKIGLAKIYHFWISFFCLIRAACLKKNAKVLDFGCGIGNYVEVLRALRMDAYGIDASVAPKKYCKSPDYCSYSAYEKLPYADGSFDLVFSCEVLEHILPEEIDFYLQELRRVSKGTVIHMIAVKERGPFVMKEPTHVLIEEESWWKNKFLAMGYKVKIGNPFYFFPCTIKGNRKGYFLLNTA